MSDRIIYISEGVGFLWKKIEKAKWFLQYSKFEKYLFFNIKIFSRFGSFFGFECQSTLSFLIQPKMPISNSDWKCVQSLLTVSTLTNSPENDGCLFPCSSSPGFTRPEQSEIFHNFLFCFSLQFLSVFLFFPRIFSAYFPVMWQLLSFSNVSQLCIQTSQFWKYSQLLKRFLIQFLCFLLFCTIASVFMFPLNLQ